MALLAIEQWGWRQAYLSTGALVLLAIGVALWLLRGHVTRHDNFRILVQGGEQYTQGHQYSRRQMLSEPRFYLMLPAMMAPSLIMTALFFFPVEIANAKQWSMQWITGSYWLYSMVTIFTSLSAGALIDRYTAKRIMSIYLLPMSAALFILGSSNHPLILLIYLVLLGITSGFYYTGLAALWAELYGTKNLGAIKSVTTAVMVFSTALGPAIVGALLSRGNSLDTICYYLAIGSLLATILLILALKKANSNLFT